MILTSQNGVSWVSKSSGSTQNIMAVNYGNSKFMGVTDYGGHVLTSTSSTSWSLSSDLTDTWKFYGLTYAVNNYVIVGNFDSKNILISTDETTWTKKDRGSENYDIEYGNNIFVTVGQSGNLRTSSDASSWTSRTSGTSSDLNGVTFGSSIFVSVGGTGTVISSSDGISWTSRTSGTSFTLNGVT